MELRPSGREAICLNLTCAVHVVSGQLKQPHVLVGDGIKGAAGKQD